MTSEQNYTNIYFSQEGYSIWFEEFEEISYNGVIFLMTEVIYQRYVILMIMEASYQEYLTINGDCVLYENFKNGRVTVSKDINIIINKQNITIWFN